MKTKRRKTFGIAVCLLAAFALWTAAIRLIDVQPIGPQNSTVGLATMNRFIHNLTGVHMRLYTITDWLGLVPLGVAMVFAMLGLSQWIRRKRLMKVDSDLLLLGGFYIAVMTVYILFEQFVVNYRPVLIGGILEASYPSSTTTLVMCVMPTAIMQFRIRLKNPRLRRIIISAAVAFIAFMVIGRLISGVHWFSDIVGGALLSAGLVMTYSSLAIKR